MTFAVLHRNNRKTSFLSNTKGSTLSNLHTFPQMMGPVCRSTNVRHARSFALCSHLDIRMRSKSRKTEDSICRGKHALNFTSIKQDNVFFHNVA